MKLSFQNTFIFLDPTKKMNFWNLDLHKKITIGIIYLITYRIILKITAATFKITSGGSTPATLFFPAIGLTMAFLLYFGIWLVPFIPLNSLISSIENGRPEINILLLPLLTLIIYGGAGIALKSYFKIDRRFKNLKDSAIFLVITTLASISIGLTFGLTIAVSNDFDFNGMPNYVLNWFLGDIVGIYSLTPILLIIVLPFLEKCFKKAQDLNLLNGFMELFGSILGFFCILLLINLIFRSPFDEEYLFYFFIIFTFIIFIVYFIYFILKYSLVNQLRNHIRNLFLIAFFISVFSFLIFFQTLFNPASIFFLFFIPLTAIALISGLKGAIIANDIIIFESLFILKFLFNSDIQQFQMVMFSLSCVALIIGTAVTERKGYVNEVENLVKERTLELENINKELEFFSYSVSHDLKNPLENINIIIELMKEKINNSSDIELNNLINRLKTNSSKMKILIDGLFKFFTFSQLEIIKEKISMESIISLSISSFFESIKRNNINLEIVSPIPNSYGDKTLISVVWTNLISNAIKFSSKTEKPHIKIGWKENKYFIEDNGTGFDMKNASRLFNVFQRLHLETEFEGSGIGLALVKKIINRHGGKIWAESTPNNGATFYFTLS